MKQSDIFANGEGVAWFKRNAKKLAPENDPILDLIKANGLKFEHTLEVGCANGWRIAIMESEGLTQSGFGIDPSGVATGQRFFKGVASNLKPFSTANFDCVIYGWCLYLCDPDDYFRIAMEGDRILKDGGFLIIHDFNSMVPHKRPYHHKEGVYSHKMNFAKLWLWNPAYHVYRAQQSGEGDSECMTWILRKNQTGAFPVRK